MTTKAYYMYVIQCADNSLYCGFTDNVIRRFNAHQSYHGAKYTRVRSRHPLKLLYQEVFDNKHDALSAEYHFKHQTRNKKLDYLKKHGININNL